MTKPQMFPSEFRRTHTAKRGIHGNEDPNGTAPPPVVVVVAVRAEKEISKTALTWALTHVVRPGDRIILLAVFSGENRGKRLWSFPIFTGDCAGNNRESSPEKMCQISESCSQMVLQFHDQNENNHCPTPRLLLILVSGIEKKIPAPGSDDTTLELHVGIKIKIVSGSGGGGVVAAESKRAGANWVVLDKQLKQEEKRCMEELHCNIVVMKHSQPKVLRLNLGDSDELQAPLSSTLELEANEVLDGSIKHTTPVGSPEEPTTSFTRTTNEDASVSSSEADSSSPLFVCERNPLFEGQNRRKSKPILERVGSDISLASSDLEKEDLISSKSPSSVSHNGNVYWIPQNHSASEQSSIIRNHNKLPKSKLGPTPRTLRENFVQFDKEEVISEPVFDTTYKVDHVFNTDVRDAVFLSRISSAPPPLCSLCQHKAPVFGKPPRCFNYRELEEATNGFSDKNFLEEGGFGSVHRGVLTDGQVVAVKQLKIAGSQGDAEFRREVGVLSCAQHRNVVMLVGFCIEGRKRVLVYEYVCNGSLDFHLYGHNRAPLDWMSRLKIAIGAARGLRYLHEDCRVGCIVHRDVRPNNILLTHDFEALVGDFGLARWQSDLDDSVEQRVIGTLGYLAPEYTEGEKITEKADVYAYGVVLLELITGRKTMGMARCKGQEFLAECSRPPLVPEGEAINHQLLDPCLDSTQLHNFSYQLRSMAQAASLCLRRDPESRPSMSKVLRILEGGDAIIPLGHDSDSVGSRSQRLNWPSSRTITESRRGHSRKVSH